jgi:hypothetical protein
MLNKVRFSRSFTSLPPIPHLLKHMLDGMHHHGENPHCQLQHVTYHCLQDAAMPNNFVFLGIELLLSKCTLYYLPIACKKLI